MAEFHETSGRGEIVKLKHSFMSWPTDNVGWPRLLSSEQRFMLRNKRWTKLGQYVATIAELSQDSYLGEYTTPHSIMYHVPFELLEEIRVSTPITPQRNEVAK